MSAAVVRRMIQEEVAAGTSPTEATIPATAVRATPASPTVRARASASRHPHHRGTPLRSRHVGERRQHGRCLERRRSPCRPSWGPVQGWGDPGPVRGLTEALTPTARASRTGGMSARSEDPQRHVGIEQVRIPRSLRSGSYACHRVQSPDAGVAQRRGGPAAVTYRQASCRAACVDRRHHPPCYACHSAGDVSLMLGAHVAAIADDRTDGRAQVDPRAPDGSPWDPKTVPEM